MESFYRINISRNGVFYLNIDHKLYSSAGIHEIVRDLRKRFPRHEGFRVGLTWWECKGRTTLVDGE
jgi:hypothetical protein